MAWGRSAKELAFISRIWFNTWSLMGMHMGKKNIFGITQGGWQELLAPVWPEPREMRAARLVQLVAKLSQHENLQHALQERQEIFGKKAWAIMEKELEFVCPVSIENTHQSDIDGSIKFVCGCQKGGKIEAVLIPERPPRLTLCISSQVGCAQGCRFCQTGRMGLLRSLEASEMIGQFLVAEKLRQNTPRLAVYPKITNIVYMGMGEPLDNVEEVIKSASIFTHPKGFGLSPNRVTVSTVGVLPGLTQLLERQPVAVAFSLHSPFEEERSRIIPANQRASLGTILNILREAPKPRSFFIQYTLIRGVNDEERHAHKLAEILTGINAKINLIPLNEHEGASYRRPTLDRVQRFQQILKNQGYVTTVRLSKGRDIQGACGQLIEQGTP